MIVAAGLAQPYIIKIAIDSHINGLYLPMVAVDESQIDEATAFMNEHNIKLKETAHFQESHYYRVDAEQLEAIELPNYITKAAVVKIDDHRYMVNGWNETLAKAEQYQLNETTNEITIDGSLYSVVPMSASDEQLFREKDYKSLILLGAIYLALIVSAALFTYYQNNSLQFTGQYAIFDIRESIMKHFSRMQISYFDKNPIGRLVTRITHDVEALNQLYSQVIVNLVREVLMLVGIIAVMLHMSVKLTLVCFIVIPGIIVITFYFRRVIRNAQRYVRHVLSTMNSYLAENLSGMRIVQLFAREERQLKQFNELNEEHYRAGMRQTILNSIFNPSIGFFGTVSLALIVWYGGRTMLDGAITFGVVYAFTHYASQFFQPLSGLADRFNQIQAALASAERIFDTLDTKPTIENPKKPIPLPENVKGQIEFNNVWFSYKEEEWVIKDLSLRINPGETIGIVGATGAGKSSIIQLINRFYDIQKGSITVDGVNIKDVHLKDLRKHIGIIQQDTFIFSGTVFDNIRLNLKHVTDEQIVAAAKSVEIDNFFRTLPQQYHTLLGEQGTVLSTGQQQLLSFLRAMIANPDILILDEATANIDTETEIAVQNTLKNISEDRTTIIIAHRLSTIQHADKIIVLNKGQIAEMGTHQELMQKRGEYYQLCQLQNEEAMLQQRRQVSN